MATITFDTLELVSKLKSAGISPEQIEAVVRVIAEPQSRLITKDDLELSLAPVKTDLAVLKWMLGVLLAGGISLVLKTFF